MSDKWKASTLKHGLSDKWKKSALKHGMSDKCPPPLCPPCSSFQAFAILLPSPAVDSELKQKKFGLAATITIRANICIEKFVKLVVKL